MKVYYLYGESTGKSVRIEEGKEITLGRATDNQVVVDDVSVSRHHAVIRWKKGGMFITDLGSTNGTFVNSEKVSADYYYELNYSDDVKIGNIDFKILDEESVIGRNFAGSKLPAKTVVISTTNDKK